VNSDKATVNTVFQANVNVIFKAKNLSGVMMPIDDLRINNGRQQTSENQDHWYSHDGCLLFYTSDSHHIKQHGLPAWMSGLD